MARISPAPNTADGWPISARSRSCRNGACRRRRPEAGRGALALFVAHERRRKNVHHAVMDAERRRLVIVDLASPECVGFAQMPESCVVPVEIIVGFGEQRGEGDRPNGRCRRRLAAGFPAGIWPAGIAVCRVSAHLVAGREFQQTGVLAVVQLQLPAAGRHREVRLHRRARRAAVARAADYYEIGFSRGLTFRLTKLGCGQDRPFDRLRQSDRAKERFRIEIIVSRFIDDA